MNRLAFALLVTLALLAAPLVGEAQQAAKAARIGYLSHFPQVRESISAPTVKAVSTATRLTISQR